MNTNTYNEGEFCNPLPYLPFYYEWLHILEDIPDEEYGKLLKSIFRYAEGEDVTESVPENHIHTFKILASVIRRAEHHRKTNRKGARTYQRKKYKAPTNSTIYDTFQPKVDTQCQNGSEFLPESPTSSTVIPPTRDEARAHFKQRGFLSDSDEFISFYNSVGWKRGNQPITDWRAASESWELCYKKKRPSEGESKSAPEKPRYGTFDIHEAFNRAVERTRSEAMADDDD